MNLVVRRVLLWTLAGAGAAALVWAVAFRPAERAEFTFVNETEIQGLDPAIVKGVPEGRIADALFEGLYRSDPRTLAPIPGVAEALPEISADGKTYTIRLRKSARWSNGDPVMAHDFHWSWMRTLHPATGGDYALQLWYLRNAKKYTQGEPAVGEPVEIELADAPDANQPFPRGTVVRGILKHVEKLDKWKREWIYDVAIDGRRRRFSNESTDAQVELCRHVLFDFRQVGVRVLDDYTLELKLENPTAFFTHLLAFYPLYPVHRDSVESHGYPNFTKPGNLVSNGAFMLHSRRIRDRIRLVKNPHYWDAENVKLNSIDALAVSARTTAFNMYMNGEVDWITVVPDAVTDKVLGRPDYSTALQLTNYFYRLNVAKPPLDNVLVRRALNMAIDKQLICTAIMRAGQLPARSFVPPGLAEYTPQPGDDFNVEAARRLLAQAGYPDGKGLPTLEISCNDDERHVRIVEVIQNQWKINLGVNATVKKMEWNAYLAAIHAMEYQVARYGWTADYPDANTYLDLFVTGGANNETGWSNREYDSLIQKAAAEPDAKLRRAILEQAERLLLREQPIIPIYYYVSRNMVRPYVKGFYPTLEDRHPLRSLSIDAEEKARWLEAKGRR